MFYTNKSLRLHSKCMDYLYLIQKANNYAENNKSCLKIYDNANPLDNIRLFNYRTDFTNKIIRYENLSNWLFYRYSNLVMELANENQKQLKKEINIMEINFVESKFGAVFFDENGRRSEYIEFPKK